MAKKEENWIQKHKKLKQEKLKNKKISILSQSQINKINR
jgi:hypothetical protein